MDDSKFGVGLLARLMAARKRGQEELIAQVGGEDALRQLAQQGYTFTEWTDWNNDGGISYHCRLVEPEIYFGVTRAPIESRYAM